MSVEPVNVAELQALLPEGTTLVEYLVSRQRHARLGGRRGRRCAVVRLAVSARAARGRGARLPPRASRARSRCPRPRSSPRRCTSSSVAPVRPHIKGKRVIVVPHDVLHYLPFGALRSKQGRWLVEDYTLSTLPSASVLKFLEAKRTAGSGGPVLAVGNPDLGSALNLRFAEREARVVADHYAGAQRAGARRRHRGARQVARGRRAAAPLRHPRRAQRGRIPSPPASSWPPAARTTAGSRSARSSASISTPSSSSSPPARPAWASSAPATSSSACSAPSSTRAPRRSSPRSGRSTTAPASCSCASSTTASPRPTPGLALQAAQRAAMKEFPHPFAWAAFGLTGVGR